MMKMFKKISLRMRLTLLMCLVLTVSCAAFSLASTRSARDIYQEKSVDDSHEESELFDDGVKTPPEAIRNIQDEDFAWRTVFISLIIIAFGTGAACFVAKSALKPVTTLSDGISRISENNLSERVAVSDTKDEVAALAVSFNRMISKLERAFLSQKSFSANAAHELRTPLTAMISSIEVCRLDEQPSLQECRETLDDVLQNAERLKVLVDDLLMMNADSRIVLHEAISARELVNQIITELIPIAGTGIRFDNLISEITLFGNRSLLYRAFFNLLHNAVKYNRPGGAVAVSGRIEGNMNVVTVADTGIGIPKEQLGRIFDSFYCVDKSRSRELGGSGLGLSIVKSIIEKHNGTIDVQSELGVSTTFTVCLPK